MCGFFVTNNRLNLETKNEQEQQINTGVSSRLLWVSAKTINIAVNGVREHAVINAPIPAKIRLDEAYPVKS